MRISTERRVLIKTQDKLLWSLIAYNTEFDKNWQASYNIAFNCLIVDQWSKGRNSDKIFVTIDQGPGQVPLGDQGSGRGSAGECQLGVNGQFLSKTVTKSVNLCLKYAWKVFNFGYVELNKERKDKLLTICLKIRNKLSLFLYWIVIQWRFLTH